MRGLRAQRAERQSRVCALYLQGLLTKDIAVQLGVSERTVKADYTNAIGEMRKRAAADMVDRRADQIARLLGHIAFLREQYDHSKAARVISTRTTMKPGPIDPATGRAGSPQPVEAIREETINEAGEVRILEQITKATAELSAVLGVRLEVATSEGHGGVPLLGGPLVSISVASLPASPAIETEIRRNHLAIQPPPTPQPSEGGEA